MTQWLVPFAGAAAVACAALMLAQRSLYAAAMCFLAAVLQVAVLLYASGARLLAMLLLLIYAGAVAVLIVVSIQASGGDRRARAPGGRWSRPGLPWPVLVAGLLLPVLDAGLLAAGAAGAPAGGTAGDLALGQALFGPYAVAAEAVALLLLFAGLAVVQSPEEKG
ncbi:MAG: NADH-quinone oxidoreductase subunit J [Elusimicrobia bacterium]|nr:NADH-quinone oxidoreductase subunit J [Elusimicrobiota bacterium]